MTQDVTQSVMFRRLRELETKGVIGREDRYLLLFAGDFDKAVFETLGFPHVVLSNLSDSELIGESKETIDARRLDYPDAEFDHVLAHAGLHHTSRPHQAVCEMYRVARKSAIFFEAQDSQMMRWAISCGFVADYEWNAIFDTDGKRGGVDDRPIPNYVYRWTCRDVEKLVRSLDPARVPKLHFMREWTIYHDRLERRLSTTPVGKLPRPLVRGLCFLVAEFANRVLGWQGNSFGVCIQKQNAMLQPWMRITPDGEEEFVPSAVKAPPKQPGHDDECCET